MFSKLRALLRPETYYTGSRLQERIDVLRLFLVTQAHSTWPEVKVRTLEQLEAHSPTMASQQSAVQELVLEQTLQLIARWKVEEPPPLPPLAKLPPHASAEVSAAAEALKSSVLAEREKEVAAAQHRAFGFAVRVAPSKAGSGAGRGVFIEGKAVIGSVVAFYPGVAMTPADLLRIPTKALKKQYGSNQYLIQRFDGTVLDASDEALKLLPPPATDCPLAAAHLVNHPPSGKQPNVLSCPVDFTEDVPTPLLPYLPNARYASAEALLLEGGSRRRTNSLQDLVRASIADLSSIPAGSTADVPLRGLVLVALRHLEDEELFLNYRLHPQKPRPPWYTPVDEEENHRRWDVPMPRKL